MSRAAEVAVAVVSWNTRPLLGRCLDSLAAEAAAARTEVWVVDNGSDDGSAELVRERYDWAKLVTPADNIGFGPAVNLVARRTKTPWIVAANADVELEPGTLDTLLAAGARHPAAGALAPRLIDRRGSTQHSVHPFPTVPLAVAFNLGLAGAVPGLADRLCLEGRWNPERERRVDWALGALLLVRRSAWDAVGGFDPGQWMYAEDLDLGWRLAESGWSTWYVPAARVRHHGAASTSLRWGAGRDERWMRSSYLWMLRRRGRIRTRLVALANLAGAAARWAVARAAVRAGSGTAGGRPEELARWTRLHAIGLARRATLERQR